METTELTILMTAGELIQKIAADFSSADLFFGHGTDNAHDEAAALVFKIMNLDHQGEVEQYLRKATASEIKTIFRISAERIQTRQPLPYLLEEAWFAGIPFYVNTSVLIPRSPIAELITSSFSPWFQQKPIKSVLEIGTGSGCIAISCSLKLPNAEVVATDISEKALKVAKRNIARYALEERIRLIQADHMDGLDGRFDLIVTNPPYVPNHEIASLPPEYLHEPELALESGFDGLDSARRIINDAPKLLSPEGLLVIEVGEQWEVLQNAYPDLPFQWLDFDFGGIGVGAIEASALKI